MVRQYYTSHLIVPTYHIQYFIRVYYLPLFPQPEIIACTALLVYVPLLPRLSALWIARERAAIMLQHKQEVAYAGS